MWLDTSEEVRVVVGCGGQQTQEAHRDVGCGGQQIREAHHKVGGFPIVQTGLVGPKPG